MIVGWLSISVLNLDIGNSFSILLIFLAGLCFRLEALRAQVKGRAVPLEEQDAGLPADKVPQVVGRRGVPFARRPEQGLRACKFKTFLANGIPF